MRLTFRLAAAELGSTEERKLEDLGMAWRGESLSAPIG